MRFAAIDQGTTSTRALVMEPDGTLHVAHSVAHRQIYPRPGWVEHDPEELIRALQACADALEGVTALGIDNQGESCLAWDSDTKQALSPVIVWQDNRTNDRINALKDQGREAETLARAGLPLDPYFSAAKLAWILQTIPAAQAAHKRGTLRLGTTDAFFLDRLTGRCVTDVTTASRTSLMNLETLSWDPVLCDLFGVPLDSLPTIVATTGDFGTMQTAHGPIPVRASITDQQAALYGFGCRAPGDVKITFGTGAFALMLTGDEIHRAPEQGLLPTIAWQFDGAAPVYALDGGVFTASAALNWARGLGLFDDFADINSFPDPAAIDTGLAFVPALSGLGCPHWDTRARGTWLGLSLDHGAPQLVQAILEGVALRAAQVLDAMSACVPLPDAIPIDGGMSRNAYFTQFLADATGRDIRPATMPELTGAGTAALAARGAGYDVSLPGAFGRVRAQSPRAEARLLFDRACQASLAWAEGDKYQFSRKLEY